MRRHQCQFVLNDDGNKKYKDAYFKGGTVKEWFTVTTLLLIMGSLEILGAVIQH